MSTRTFTLNVTAPSAPWYQDQAVNTWREIAGTSLSLQPTMPDPNGANAISSKQDAWCGWCINPNTSEVYSVGQGGHDDYWGNEVERIRLGDAAPAWEQIATFSPPSAVLDPTGRPNYYADGRPTATHGYYTQVFVPSVNRCVRFPGGSHSAGGEPTTEITAFNTMTGQYDPQSTWSGLVTPFAGGGGDHAYALHPTTNAVYAWIYNSKLVRWNAGTPGSWTELGVVPPVAVSYTAAACDPTRGTGGQVFFLGGGAGGNACHRYDIGTNSISAITLTGTDIKTATTIGLVYVQATDRYYACIPSTGGSSVYVITPTTGTSWACSLLSTTGGASIPATAGGTFSGPFTKFLYAPLLGGCVFGPRWGSNLFFLKLH